MSLPDPSKDSIAIVTGASSGIGAELARGLARRGHNVGLVARRRDRLEELAGELQDVRAEVFEADLESAGARDQLAQQIEELGLHVAVLCNNAGFGTYDDFCELDREREIAEVRTNVEAVVDLTGRYLPAFLSPRTPFVIRGMHGVEKLHPTEPHYYLSILGVEPVRHGEGLGSALLQPMLRRCDSEGVGAYLETGTERNVRFYSRQGFRVTDEVALPNGPPMWLMWRDPL